MKKAIVFLIIIVTSCNCYSQFVYKLKADSVKITNDSCSAELIIENSSKNVGGFLFNNGNGRTVFKRGLSSINSKKYLIGADTLDLTEIGMDANLQVVTSKGRKTSNVIWSRSLVLADTTLTGITANGAGASAGGKTITGTIAADAIGSLAYGNTDSGAIRASQNGAIAFGSISAGSGSITASNYGSISGGAAGYTTDKSKAPSILASGEASFAHGSTYGGVIKATNYGSFANGFLNGKGGSLNSSGYGSTVMGFVQGLNPDSIMANGHGTFAGGYVSNTTANSIPIGITVTGLGSLGYGYVANNGSSMSVMGAGSFAHGQVITRGTISVTGNGAAAFGFAQKKGKILATREGAVAFGMASDSLVADGTQFSTIQATHWGAFARGYAGRGANGSTGNIISSGRGATAGGFAEYGNIYTSGDGSFANGWTGNMAALIQSAGAASFINGYVTGTDSLYTTGTASFLSGGKLYNTGNYSSLFGYGIRNTSNNTFKIGWNFDQFTVDGNSNLITISSVVTYDATTEPPPPPAGKVVEWWDGTNKKYKKSNGDSGNIY